MGQFVQVIDYSGGSASPVVPQAPMLFVIKRRGYSMTIAPELWAKKYEPRGWTVVKTL